MSMSGKLAECYSKGNSNLPIAASVATCYVSTMDHRQARKANFDALLSRYARDAEFARETGISAPIVSQIKHGERQLGDTLARRIEVSLRLGHGYMDQPHGTDEQSADYSARNTAPGPDIRGHVPLISWVQAGAWSEAVDLYAPGDAEDWVACAASHGPRTFALRVHGDSMTSPHGLSVPAGNLIYVDPDQRGHVSSGSLVVARLCGSDEVTFKRFVRDAGRCFLQPLNPHYPPIYDEFEIIGLVIGAFQHFQGL